MMNCRMCGQPVPNDAAYCPECGKTELGGAKTLMPEASAADVAVYDVEIGTTFADRYVVDEKIGAGSMGAVYRATDTLTQQQVALKVMRPGQVTDCECK